MIKIVKNEPEPKFVTPSQMKTGQVGIIRKWLRENYIGLIVVKTPQKTLCSLDLAGVINGDFWTDTDFFNDINVFEIELLPAGTKLEITLGKNE